MDDDDDFAPYPEALELAATAGDAHSQWLCGKRRVKEDRFECSSWYIKDRAFVQSAVENRYPLAQMAWGRALTLSGDATAQQRLQGAKLWLSGYIGNRSFDLETLPVRLLKLSKENKDFRLDGTRTKFNYKQFLGSGIATCGIRIDYKNSRDCQIVLENLPDTSHPNVSRSSGKIATNLLYNLLLSGVDLHPEDIQWFEAFPLGTYHDGSGSLVSVVFKWDGTTYARPDTRGFPEQPIRIDLSDILGVPAHG